MNNITEIQPEEEKLTEFVEVKMKISMSKSICLDVEEGYSKEDLVERAKKEIVLPDKVMKVMKDLLAKYTGYVVTEGEDWLVDEIEVITE